METQVLASNLRDEGVIEDANNEAYKQKQAKKDSLHFLLHIRDSCRVKKKMCRTIYASCYEDKMLA